MQELLSQLFKVFRQGSEEATRAHNEPSNSTHLHPLAAGSSTAVDVAPSFVAAHKADSSNVGVIQDGVDHVMGAVDHIQHAPARQGKTNVRQETQTSGRVRRCCVGVAAGAWNVFMGRDTV